MCGPALLPHHRDHRALTDNAADCADRPVRSCVGYTWNVVKNPLALGQDAELLVWVLLHRVYTRFRVRE